MTPIVPSCRRGGHASKILPSIGPPRPYHTSDTEQGLGQTPSKTICCPNGLRRNKASTAIRRTRRGAAHRRSRNESTWSSSAADLQLQSPNRIAERKERKVEVEASPNLQVVVDRRHRRGQVVEIDSSRPAAGSWSSRKIDWSRRLGVAVVLTSTSTAKKSIGLTYSCTSTTQYFHCKLAQPPPGWRPPTRDTPCEHRQRAGRYTIVLDHAATDAVNESSAWCGRAAVGTAALLIL